MKKILHKISSPDESLLKTVLKLGYFLFTRPGMELIARKGKRFLEKSGVIKDHDLSYAEWILANTNHKKALKEYNAVAASWKHSPSISIVIYTNEGSSLMNVADCLYSVANQVYPMWNVHLLYPESMHAEMQNIITESPIKTDQKISLNVYAPGNRKTQEINKIAKTVTGSYILLLDPRDELTANCLFELVKHMNSHPKDELIYTDHDKGAWDKPLSDPHFKPSWSPDTLLGTNYIGSACCMSKALWMKLNGLDENISENYLHDLLLRAAETTDHIGHISKVLFHINTPSANYDGKIIENALARRNTPGTVTAVLGAAEIFAIDYTILHPGKVSIVIPTKDNVAMLKTTLDSILTLTTNTDYEIILLNNNSTSTEFFDLAEQYTATYSDIFRCIPANFPFNFSQLINLGVKESNGKYILMLNNDVEVLHGDWLTKMMGYAEQQHIGAVGAKLLFPDETIQHAGVVLGVGEAAAHAFINLPKESEVNFNAIRSTRNYSAVTAACLMVRKDVYNNIGGMDETLPVEFNDIDFCLKLRKAGYYNVYLPSVQLYHYESATRGHPFKSIASWKQHEKDISYFRKKWGTIVDNDPFYNPNLSTEYTDFRMKKRIKP